MRKERKATPSWTTLKDDLVAQPLARIIHDGS